MVGWSSDELARRSGIHRRSIRKIERGETHPQRLTLSRMVSALVAGGAEFEADGAVKLAREEAPKWNFP